MIPDSNLGPLHVCAPMRTLTHMCIYMHIPLPMHGDKRKEKGKFSWMVAEAEGLQEV